MLSTLCRNAKKHSSNEFFFLFCCLHGHTVFHAVLPLGEGFLLPDEFPFLLCCLHRHRVFHAVFPLGKRFLPSPVKQYGLAVRSRLLQKLALSRERSLGTTARYLLATLLRCEKAAIVATPIEKPRSLEDWGHLHARLHKELGFARVIAT